MPKKTYYVALGPGEIVDDPHAFDSNFAIEATDDELDKLQKLFEDSAEAGGEGRSDTELYRMLHQLGTPETKERIESMHILPETPVT